MRHFTRSPSSHDLRAPAAPSVKPSAKKCCRAVPSSRKPTLTHEPGAMTCPPMMSSSSVMRSVILAGLVASVLAPSIAYAVGESIGGFPNYRERVIHQRVNRARADPEAELAACGPNCSEMACYKPVPPFQFSESLNRAARFHADEMAQQAFFSEASMCTVVDKIAATYPDICDGSAACACVGGTSGCMPLCDSAADRAAKWAAILKDEAIAMTADPKLAYEGWMFEDAMGTVGCVPGPGNADRSLLLGDGGAIGFGVASGHAVGDVGGPGAGHKIASGIHWPPLGPKTEVWASWFDPDGPPMRAAVNFEGTCRPLELARGTPENGAYWTVYELLPQGCYHYYFQFVDANGVTVTYPTTGSLVMGLEGDCPEFSDERPLECECIPDYGDVECGDDGCGGWFSKCNPWDVCYENYCCQPDCPADACGPDGCGGECIVCPEGQRCQLDICIGGTSGDPWDPTTGEPSTGAPTTGEQSTGTGHPEASTGGTTSGTEPPNTSSVTAPGGDPKGTDAGCGCRNFNGAGPWVFVLLAVLGRRRRTTRARRNRHTTKP